MADIKTGRMVFAVFAVAILAAACVVPVLGSGSDAAAGDSQGNPYTVNIVKGQSWQYTPTFPSSLSPTITIEKQGSDWTSTNGTYASVSSGKVTVAIPSNASSGSYKVVIKASTTQPTQVARQYVQFNIVDPLTLSGTTTVKTYVGGSVNWTPTTNAGSLSGAAYSLSGTLPSGLSFNSSNGKITGTPTAEKSSASYTLTVTTANPAQSKTLTVAISVEKKVAISGASAVYAAVGGAQDSAAVTASVGSSWSITGYGSLSSSKVSISSSGVITVTGLTAGDVGSHTITVKATSNTVSANTATKTITITVAEQLLYTSEPSAGMVVSA